MKEAAPVYPTAEYFKRRAKIARVLVGLEMSAGIQEYNLALELLSGATEHWYPLRRTLWQRLKDAFKAGWVEFKRTQIHQGPKAP